MNFSAAINLIVSYFDMWYVLKMVKMIRLCLFKCEYLVSSCFCDGRLNVSGLWMSCNCEKKSTMLKKKKKKVSFSPGSHLRLAFCLEAFS